MPKVQAVFLDRDGVINTHLPERYVETPEQLAILPGVAKAIRRLNDAGVAAIVISNQQGVGRGIMTWDALEAVTDSMKTRLFDEAGASLDAIYYCPHLRTDNCDCRKPKPGMISHAAQTAGIHACDTAFVGDSTTDLEAAAAAGVRYKILVLSGANQYYDAAKFKAQPDLVFSNLNEIVGWLLEDDCD